MIYYNLDLRQLIVKNHFILDSDDFVYKVFFMKKELREKSDWNEVWIDIKLPRLYKKSCKSPFSIDFLSKLEQYYKFKKGTEILELGGAPGGYAAYFHKKFGYNITVMDYSDVGIEKTIENFKLLGIQGGVIKRDFLEGEKSKEKKYDIVYSLGVIEHFDNMLSIVKKHLIFLKKGGILMIGVPNFLGINKYLMKRLSPKRLSEHNLNAMDKSNWNKFEKELPLKKIFLGYIGGFVPSGINFKEKYSETNKILGKILYILDKIFIYVPRILNPLRLINSKFNSYYLLGIYRYCPDYEDRNMNINSKCINGG